jgi:hypothetical protein
MNQLYDPLVPTDSGKKDDLSNPGSDKESRGRSCCRENSNSDTCRDCDSGILLQYWCETCQLLVMEKRCPSCGLKARKVRPQPR